MLTCGNVISLLIPKNWNTIAGECNFTTDTFPTDYKFRDYAQQVTEQLKVDLWIIPTTLCAIYKIWGRWRVGNYVGIPRVDEWEESCDRYFNGQGWSERYV
jgi:hypothetical protein